MLWDGFFMHILFSYPSGEQEFMQSVSKVKSFFAAHKAARVLLVIAAALLAFVLIFHPHGTKTYLITGIDNYGSLNDNGRSDVMMLVQVGFDSGKIHAVTFARDIVVPNEHNKNVKLNTIVRMQDEDALVDTLERVFDLKIDGWFRINFSSVITIIDAMGGVQLELTDAEARYINGREGEYPDYPLAEGLCRLNGAQSLCYARCRKLDNDIGRGDRQTKLFSSLVKQTKKMTAANVVSVVRNMSHAWQSSLSSGEQAKLVFDALWMRGAQVVRSAVPYEGYWHYGESSVVLNLDENVRLLHETLGLPEPKTE